MIPILKRYEELLDIGVKKDFQDQLQEYQNKRSQSQGDGKDNVIIISPSKASFHLNMGSNICVFKGECHRKAFMASAGFSCTNETDCLSIRRMRYGQVYETQEHEYETKAGLLIEKNLRVNKHVTPDVMISGEVDSIVEVDGKKYICEIKSYDGYWAAKMIQGNKTTKGSPKYEHIIQNMFYLMLIKDKYPEIDSTIFHYRTRGDLVGTFHLLTLEYQYDSNGTVLDAYPVINGCRFTYTSLRELITRGVTLSNYIKNNVLPPRDPEYMYSDEKIAHLLSLGEVSKSKYKEWEAGETIIGDWQCFNAYCPYHNLCLGQTPKDRDSWPSDEEIMSKLHLNPLDKNLDSDTMIWAE